MSNDVFQAGVARVDITPPVGMRLIGYAVREGVSHGIDEPLFVTALALQGVGLAQTVLLLAADLGLVLRPFADEVRRACAEAIGVDASQILLNYNHTHSAPATTGYFPADETPLALMEAEYSASFLHNCVTACSAAMQNLQPARLATGWGECKANINRRQKSPDGEVVLGENPDGACDHSVGVLRVDDLAGQPLAIAFRYSCHTVTVGPKTNVISPDFAGPARAVVEAALACPSLFLQGCAGNINPQSGIGQDSDNAPNFTDDKNRLGHRLGGEVLRIAQTLCTHRRRASAKFVESVARYWMYEYQEIPLGAPGKVKSCECEMELPLKPFPSPEELERECAAWAARLDDARKQSASDWVLNPLIRFNLWVHKRRKTAEHSNHAATEKFSIQTFRIGGLNIVALPFEPMAETGIALREALGPDTFVLGYCNGMVSYLPTPEISAEGGMEARLGYIAYLLPAELPGDWEPKIKEQVISQFQRGMEG